MSTATYQAAYRKDRYLVGYRRVDATATRRRLRGLLRLGWSLKQVAAETGLDRGHLSKILTGDLGDRVNVETEALVQRFVSCHWGPAPDNHTSRRMRSLALARGYQSLYAWDDISDVTEQNGAS